MLNDLFVTYCSCYGAEMRGGTVNCTVCMSDDEIADYSEKFADLITQIREIRDLLEGI